MPIYSFMCVKGTCRETKDVLCGYDQLGKQKPRCPKHKVVMQRVYSAPALVTGTSGQKELLAKKQEYKKTRSRAHFKNEVLPKLKDPAERRHFEKKFKGTKKVDHTKLK